MFMHKSLCSEDIISSILSCERRKKGKVVANSNVFDWYRCVVSLLVQVAKFVKCLRQEMIACIATRNSGDDTDADI